jgi:hypothetical protein
MTDAKTLREHAAYAESMPWGLEIAEALRACADQIDRVSTDDWLHELAAAIWENAARIARDAYDDSSKADSPFDGGAGSCGWQAACNEIECRIRAKQAAKPKMGPLPGVYPDRVAAPLPPSGSAR